MFEAFITGIQDGFNQPYELSYGMTYKSAIRQFVWDIGCYIGQYYARIKLKISS